MGVNASLCECSFRDKQGKTFVPTPSGHGSVKDDGSARGNMFEADEQVDFVVFGFGFNCLIARQKPSRIIFRCRICGKIIAGKMRNLEEFMRHRSGYIDIIHLI